MAQSLSAGELCRRIVVGERETPLPVAAQRMREQHAGCLVVVEAFGSSRHVVGMLTARDIVACVMAQAVDPCTLRVEDVMTTDVVTARESDPFAELLATMCRQGIRRLPILDAQGVLVGLVTLDDLLEILAEQLRAVVQGIDHERRHERTVRR